MSQKKWYDFHVIFLEEFSNDSAESTEDRSGPKSPRQLESDAGEEASAAFSMTMAAKLEAKTRAGCEAASAC